MQVCILCLEIRMVGEALPLSDLQMESRKDASGPCFSKEHYWLSKRP